MYREAKEKSMVLKIKCRYLKKETYFDIWTSVLQARRHWFEPSIAHQRFSLFLPSNQQFTDYL
ncbi:MAG: hypothetical protein GTN73_02710 [Candidatus Aminicenantes bacterium]|nr:hypothetical protein [Candidatus Aminicenantes bacterium]